MNDKKFIEFLYRQIVEEQTDGDDFDFDTIITEMKSRGYEINSQELFIEKYPEENRND